VDCSSLAIPSLLVVVIVVVVVGYHPKYIEYLENNQSANEKRRKRKGWFKTTPRIGAGDGTSPGPRYDNLHSSSPAGTGDAVMYMLQWCHRSQSCRAPGSAAPVMARICAWTEGGKRGYPGDGESTVAHCIIGSGGRCWAVLSSSAPFEPSSTPRAVARETGGGWWVVLVSWHCPMPLFVRSTHDPPSEQLDAGVEVGAGWSGMVVRCWGA
jgi:hypothetical protein